MQNGKEYRRAAPARSGAPRLNSLHSFFVLLLVVGMPWMNPGAQPPTPSTATALTADQVVQNLVQMNHRRAESLRSYEGSRSYRVDYRGFPGNRSAEMLVNVKYRSPGSKDFAVQSSTGSALIVDRVFKKLLEAEKEALAAENQRRSALTPENYRFTLIGLEHASAGDAYVLQVEPRTKDKFLYRGKMWVDAKDFAVVRLEVEPAKNPSFWTKSTEIEQLYQKVGDFWLPASNRSVTTVRLGGHAELTILYKDYKITGERPVDRVAESESNLKNSVPAADAALR